MADNLGSGTIWREGWHRDTDHVETLESSAPSNWWGRLIRWWLFINRVLRYDKRRVFQYQMSAKFRDTQQITTECCVGTIVSNSPQLIINSVLELFVSLRLFTESILTETERRWRGRGQTVEEGWHWQWWGWWLSLVMMSLINDVVTGTTDRKIATYSSFNFLIK